MKRMHMPPRRPKVKGRATIPGGMWSSGGIDPLVLCWPKQAVFGQRRKKGK